MKVQDRLSLDGSTIENFIRQSLRIKERMLTVNDVIADMPEIIRYRHIASTHEYTLKVRNVYQDILNVYAAYHCITLASFLLAIDLKESEFISYDGGAFRDRVCGIPCD